MTGDDTMAFTAAIAKPAPRSTPAEALDSMRSGYLGLRVQGPGPDAGPSSTVTPVDLVATPREV